VSEFSFSTYGTGVWSIGASFKAAFVVVEATDAFKLSLLGSLVVLIFVGLEF